MAEANDKDYFDLLLKQTKWMRQLAYQLVGKDRAEDIVQETLSRALTSPPRDSDSPGRWLKTVLRNEALRVLRQEKRRRERETHLARSRSPWYTTSEP